MDLENSENSRLMKESMIRNPYKRKRTPPPSSPRQTGSAESRQEAGMVPTLRFVQNPYQKGSKSTGRGQAAEEEPSPNSNNVDAMASLPDKHIAATKQQATEESASALVISASFKAGMDGIDRQAIDAIILRESGNSKYMQQQRKRDQVVNEKIERLQQRLSTTKKIPAFTRDTQLETFIRSRPARSVYCMVDMDMFYMACELQKYPALAHVPACVGGPGMILTSNYVARKFGVRSAMPGYIGQKLVEELSEHKLHFCKPNYELYKQKSSVFKSVLAQYDPNLRMYSLDEAYVDLTNYLVHKILHPSLTHEQLRDKVAVQDEDLTDVLLTVSASKCLDLGDDVLQDMRERVKIATGGLTCSAGLASNFLLAKIASDMNKPDGQKLVGSAQDDITSFLYPLSIRKISGIGRVTEKILTAFDVNTVQDLYDKRALVCFLFGDDSASTDFLLRACVGCSGSRDGDQPQKGISRERTMNCKDWTDINVKLGEIAELLSSDMKQKHVYGSTITIKVKLTNFQVYSRSRTVSRCVQNASDLLKVASELLREVRASQTDFAVRLLGIRCSNLTNTAGQTTMDTFLKSPPRATTPPPNWDANPYSPVKTRNKTSPESAALLEQHQEEEIPSPRCPVCNNCLKTDDWDKINQHVDACLNGNTIRELVRESSRHDEQKKKPSKQTLTHYFASNV